MGEYPIHLGAAEDFEKVRGALRRANFTEQNASPYLPPQMQPPGSRPPERSRVQADLLSAFVRLFVRNVYVSLPELESTLSREELDAFERLGLIVPGEHSARTRYSPVSIFPIGGVFTVADSLGARRSGGREAGEDVVYPAAVPNTRLFLSLLPESKCDALLDLCSGTGVAALIGASKYATAAFAFDIADRSTHFAEFAQRLNGLTNVTAATGDLYEPAGDQTFDRIVAHPPYVPVQKSKWIFYDGGQDGEYVTRRIIEQAPRYLRPGGTLYCLAMATDRKGKPLEIRIREWLGAQENDFDVAAVVRRVVTPEEFAFQSLVRGETEGEQARRWKDLFDALEIEMFPYAMMMVHRKQAEREPFTVRAEAGPQTGRKEHEWLLAWESHAASHPDAVLSMHLATSMQAELRVVNRIQESTWQSVAYTLKTEYPFKSEATIDAWVGYLLSICDGSRTGAEILQDLQQREVLGPSITAADFAQVLNKLVSGGFLLAS